MHPILIQTGNFTLHTFGLMAALGVLAGSTVVLREARREKVDEELIRRITFAAVVATIVGGRLLDVLVNWERFAGQPLEALMIWKGGLVFYGGGIGIMTVLVASAWLSKRPLLQLTDIFSPGGMAGLAFGRVGCLMAGDDYGKPTTLPWGIRFTDEHSLVPYELRGVPLHPTQIYMMLNAVFIFLVLRWLAPRKRFQGQVTATMFILYAINRSIIELFRGDEDRGFLFNHTLSTSQFISIWVGLAGVAIYVWKGRGAARPAEATPEAPRPEAPPDAPTSASSG